MMETERTAKCDADRVEGHGRQVVNVPGRATLESALPAGANSTHAGRVGDPRMGGKR